MNLLGKQCGERTIVRIFDLCTGSYIPQTVLASVQYDDMRFGVVIVNVTTRTISPLSATGRLGMLLNEATQPPIFEVDTDCGFYEVNIYTLGERGVIVREEYIDPKAGANREWQVVGECSSGSTALKEFQKHGIAFEANEKPVR